MLAECGLSAPGHKNVDGLTVRDIAKKHKLDKVLQYLDRNEKREAPPGKLSAIRKKSNKEEGYLEELLYKYDELGNLIEKHIYKKGVFTTDIQIMYSSKTKLLSTVLTREVATDFMMILRFRDYEFFE